MPDGRTPGIRMNVFFSAVKALLLLLGLNAVLAMALAAFALHGMIALRLSLLLGVFFSADLLALLLFLKVRLTPEPRRGLARFFSARNCVLAFLLSGLAAGGFYYHAAVLSEHRCDSFREISPLLHSGAALRRLLPETASDIRFYENRIPPCSLEWRCRLASGDFRAFAAAKNWIPAEIPDRNPRDFFGRFLPDAAHFPADAFFFPGTFADGTFFILYDTSTQTMYGRIAGR